MPLTWNIITDENDKEWAIWDGQLRVPVEFDPTSQVIVAVAPPDGFANLPAIAKGDNGFSPTFDTPTLTELDHDDVTPASITFTLVTPATNVAGPVYHADITLHKGEPGEDGDTVLDPSDYGTPVAGRIPAVNSAVDAFELVPQKVGGQYWPAAIVNLSDNGTLCAVAVPAQPFAWRPRVAGQCLVSGGGSDVRVDVIARLNNATTGHEVGRGFGQAGIAPPRNDIIPGVPQGSATNYGQVDAGAAATVYFRAEKQSGSASFSTSSSTSSFWVEVAPLP